jgi:hypothetical protein
LLKSKGKHAWGSSDPAFWHQDLLQCVIPPRNSVGKGSFYEGACAFLAAKEFGRAMWAARLGLALENAENGEKVTSQILSDPEVEKRLSQIRKRPDSRDTVFGKAPPLRTWVSGDPGAKVFSVAG